MFLQKKIWAEKKIRSKKYFGLKKIYSQINPFGPKKIFWSEKVKSNLRPAVLTIESILVGDNCHQDKCCMRKCLCYSCP